MTDINKRILEKAQGACRLNPDEQKKFLETFAERVIATASIEETNSPLLAQQFKEILEQLSQTYEPLFVKISPNVETYIQVNLVKIARSLNIQTSIVSEDCQYSPFGLVLHSDHPIDKGQKDLKELFPDLLGTTEKEPKEKKKSFWEKLFR